MDPVTPPAAVRAAALFSYCYSWFLGCMALATQSPVYAKGALLTLTTVYLADAALAACPLKWCNMRGIPPTSILKHHLPFAIALFPNLILVVFYDQEFTEVTSFIEKCFIQNKNLLKKKVILEHKFIITGIAAGSMTSANEALWVASSFFTQDMLQSKTYKVGQKLSSVVALCEVCGSFFF